MLSKYNANKVIPQTERLFLLDIYQYADLGKCRKCLSGEIITFQFRRNFP